MGKQIMWGKGAIKKKKKKNKYFDKDPIAKHNRKLFSEQLEAVMQ